MVLDVLVVQSMILLITPYARAQECSEAMEEATAETTQVAENLSDAATRLHAEEYSAVVIDQSLLEADPDESETVLQHVGTAVPIYVNFAISGKERVVRELRTALRRRTCEQLIARKAAELALRSDLNGAVTAMLLSCELALELPNLPILAREKIRTVHDLARELRRCLGIGV